MVGTLSGVWAVADVGAAVLVVTLILLASGLTAARDGWGCRDGSGTATGC